VTDTTTTGTTIEIPDYIARAKSLGGLMLIAADLLEHAEDSGLPAPDIARLSHRSQEISLSFPGHRDTFHALADWATRFGGTVTGEPYTRDDGEQSVYCQARFPYLGITVEAYAFIPADQLSIT
jgi:hypothetical protein